MSFKHTLEILTKDIQDIEKLVSNFQNYSRIPSIEIDLTLSKLQNLYEMLLLLRDSGGESIVPGNDAGVLKSPEIPEVISAEPMAPQALPKEESVRQSEENAAISVPTPQEDNIPEPPPAPRVSPEERKRKEKVIGESFEGNKRFVNESLGNKAETDPATSRFSGGHIKSITGSIGINDKFLFIRELFAGDAEKFRSCLEILDASSNFNEAYDYLLTNFDWDMDSEVVQQLLALLRRKFISTGNV